jgi:nitrogen fixation-related uncharacterized protein
VFHYFGFVIIGTNVSYFIIALFSVYGIGFYAFSWVFKNNWYPDFDRKAYRLLGHIQLRC